MSAVPCSSGSGPAEAWPALLALACVAAGFVCFTILDDEREVLISSGVVAVAALIGGVTIRSAAFYAPAGWWR